MASYSIGVQSQAWIGQADAILARLDHVDDLIDQLADSVVLPILARHYDASGLHVRSGVLKQAISKRGAFGNTFQKTAMGMIVGVDYSAIPYARSIIEGARPHDIPGAFGRGHGFGVGGPFSGKFHPGNRPHDIYFLTDSELREVEASLTQMLLGDRSAVPA